MRIISIVHQLIATVLTDIKLAQMQIKDYKTLFHLISFD